MVQCYRINNNKKLANQDKLFNRILDKKMNKTIKTMPILTSLENLNLMK
jgi:hypothetical protein